MKLKLRVSFREVTELRGYLYYISGRAHWQPDLPWVMVTGINHWESVCQLFPLRSCLFHISFPHSLVRNQNMWPIPSDTLPTARRHPLQQGHASYECHSYEPMGANFMQTTTYIHTYTYIQWTHTHIYLWATMPIPIFLKKFHPFPEERMMKIQPSQHSHGVSFFSCLVTL